MAQVSTRATLAVDVGGTFTDAVVRIGSASFSGKCPTTPADQSIGVLDASMLALAAAELQPADVESFIHGMTVTTNALLEGNFARTALLTTEGFTDLEEIGRQNRADLYKLYARRPEPIVPEELRFGLRERCGPSGVITALDESSVRSAVAAALAGGAEALAVCLLFSFRHPEHELRVAEIARETAPDLHISLSHRVVGTFREYERLVTTVVDAALSPRLSGYLSRLSERATESGLPEPLVMLSNGGTAPLEFAASNAATTVLSGPAGGAVAAVSVAERTGYSQAVAFDMGGTSTDICLVANGAVALAGERSIAGRPIALPSVDISTVGAGGGSIAWRDDGGALRVGPRSAGAHPGPAAYGHGGAEPTVTDANLMLGWLGDGAALAGGLQLDRAAAEAALSRLGDSLGLSAIETAAGIVEIANLEMLRKAASVTVARGIDPRGHALIAFGGAGPMHAAAIAESLEINTVICPDACGVLSAWGMTASGKRRDRSRSIVRPLDAVPESEITAIVGELADSAAAELGLDRGRGQIEVSHELRYAGQSFELGVHGAYRLLAANFHAAHEERFGFARLDHPIELVTLRVGVIEPATTSEAGAAATRAPARSRRSAWFGGEAREALVLSGPPSPGDDLSGPALIELPEATIVVPPSWSGRLLGVDMILTRGQS